MPLPPAFNYKVGTFTMPAVDGMETVTGVGFRPKAVILFSAGNENAATWEGVGTAAEKTGLSVAMFTLAEVPAFGDPERLGGTLYEASIDDKGSLGGPGPENNCGLYQKSYRVRDSDDVLIGEATFAGWDADGFTLDWKDVTGVEPIIGYIAIGGEAVVAKVVKWALPVSLGTVEVPVGQVGFQPDVVFHLCGSGQFSPTPWLDAAYTDSERTAFRLGAMDADGNQWAIGYARDNGVPSNSKRSLRTDRAIHGTEYNSVPAVSAEYVSMNADGFTMRAHGNTQATVVVSLAIAGVKARVGTATKPATTSSVATSGVGFTPQGLILCSTALAAPGETDGILASLGAASSSSARAAVARFGEDAADPTNEQKRTHTDKVFYGPPTEVTHADLASFDSDGFTLSWTTSFNGSFLVPYIAFAAPDVPVHRFDMELNGVDGGWTNVTRDTLLEEGVNIRYGIAGTGPLDLVASTGTMKLVLDNSENNSAGMLGYYSPRHPNRRPGFKLGIRVRYTYVIPGSDSSEGYGKFIGRLRDIQPAPGRYRERKTVCQVVDWMNEAAITKYNAPTQVDKRADEILETIVALVPRQPDSTDFDVADSTFPYALDNGPVERSTVITEIQRICQSEFGRFFVCGGLNYWGQARFERRTARLTPLPVATFDGTMQSLEAGSGTGKVKNRAKVTAHPRRVDGAATTILFSKPNQNNPLVQPLQTLRLSGRYVDPSNPNARVGGVDMVSPVATTDYLMNSLANGSGSNLTANFTVVATYGANQVDYAITNNHGSTPGYVTFLQARGRGLYDYDPLEAEETNETSIEAIGESGVQLDMPYQSDFAVTQAVAEFLIDTWSSSEGGPAAEGSPGVTETSIGVVAKDEDEQTELMAREPGHAIVVREELSVVNDVYFIQNVTIRIDGDKTSFDFDLQRALVQDFWQLGDAGFSELGETTVLAPL